MKTRKRKDEDKMEEEEGEIEGEQEKDGEEKTKKKKRKKRKGSKRREKRKIEVFQNVLITVLWPNMLENGVAEFVLDLTKSSIINNWSWCTTAAAMESLKTFWGLENRSIFPDKWIFFKVKILITNGAEWIENMFHVNNLNRLPDVRIFYGYSQKVTHIRNFYFDWVPKISEERFYHSFH